MSNNVINRSNQISGEPLENIYINCKWPYGKVIIYNKVGSMNAHPGFVLSTDS